MKFLVIVLTSSHICFLERAVNSIITQKDNNLSYDIMINVNTLDKNYFPEVVNKLKNTVKYIVETKSNGKPGMGHNSCLELFKNHTEYTHLIILDGDDLFYPYAFYQYQQILNKNPELDILHLMINDKISTIDHADKDSIDIIGKYKFYTNMREANNWWEVVNLENPYEKPLSECRTPSRILLVSQNIFNTDIPIEYCNNCKLYDDFKAFLSIIENQYTNKLNTMVTSILSIYCYNANNTESSTFNFKEYNMDNENKFFNEYKNNYTNISKNWDLYKTVPYIKFDEPINFLFQDKINFCVDNVIKFEINDNYFHGHKYFTENNYIKCIFYLSRITEVQIEMPEVYLMLAISYHNLKNYEKTIIFSNFYLSSNKEFNLILYKILIVSYYNTKQYNKSYYYILECLKENKNNIDEKFINEIKNKIKNKQFLIKKTKIKQKMDKPILCIYTGYHTGIFDGNTYKTNEGVYGSEISAVYLAEQLQKEYNVFVFCLNDKQPEKINGVFYLHLNNYNEFNELYVIDILIVSRFLNFFQLFKNEAKKTYLWCHDLLAHPYTMNTEFTKRGFNLLDNLKNKFNNIVCVSKWHKEAFKEIYNIEEVSNLICIENGLNPNNFQKSVKKIKNKFIYCSNPDRGLDILLKLFPKIQEKITDATLDIYFGEIDEKLLNIIKTLDGVKFHGRIQEDLLCEKMMEADVFFYPNRSHETFCINALNALASGCIVIARKFSGIVNTVNNHGILIYGNPEEDTWQQTALQFIFNILDNEKVKLDIQEKARSYGKQQTWEKSANKWITIFKK